MSRPKSVILTGDWHCGHRTGLTPPKYQDNPNGKLEHFAKIQSITWDWFSGKIDSIRNNHGIDVLVLNGDSIDGTGHRSGGTELIHTDRNYQVEMAIEAASFVDAKKHAVILGTPYHVGESEEFERNIASELNATVCGHHEFIEVNGVFIDLKHKVGSSGIPHGRNTAISKTALWNKLWAEKGVQPKASIFVRSHVHYFGYSGDYRELRITLPCLQGWTRYGAAQCEGTIDIGFVHMLINPDGSYSWTPYLLDMSIFKQEVYRL